MRSFAIDEPGSSVRALYATLLGGEAIEDSISEQIIHFQDIEG